jgi:hypothetical protein
MLERLTAADFGRHQGDRFLIAPSAEPAFEVELIEVTESDAVGPAANQFSLVFRAAPIRRCHSASTAIEHGELGAIEIFLVPIGPDEVDQRYQAIFT